MREEYKTTGGIRHYNHRPDSQATLIDLMNKVEYLTGLVKYLINSIEGKVDTSCEATENQIYEANKKFSW